MKDDWCHSRGESHQQRDKDDFPESEISLIKISKLPVPVRDSKRGRDGGGKNENGVFCH